MIWGLFCFGCQFFIEFRLFRLWFLLVKTAILAVFYFRLIICVTDRRIFDFKSEILAFYRVSLELGQIVKYTNTFPLFFKIHIYRTMKLYIINFEKIVITTRHDMTTYSLDCGDPNIGWIELKILMK